ncbi:MAG: Gfo/Idh/MocA family oxidoreductase [Clostridia bacterium]|nr:Gfo/Idh/MocA family oxidoreductase [Clostridia bacterium]
MSPPKDLLRSVKPMRVGVVGSGLISRIYLENMTRRFEILEVGGVCSAHFENAKRRADEFGLPAMTLEDMLADARIDMIVNLTPTPAHEGIIRQALEAGKHVYTEKTMTTGHESARALADLAAKKGLWLGSAPDTFLGAALQTARRAIDDGLIGEVTSFAFAANRDNDYLRSFYRFLNLPFGGVAYDYAVYYLTALCSLVGPVARVAAAVRAPYPTRVDIDPKSKTYGQRIDTPNESEISAVLTLKSGVSGTAHVNADSVIEDMHFFAIYGTKGILYLPDPNGFGGEVRLQPNWAYDAAPAPARALGNRPYYADNSRGVGPAELAWSVRAGRPARAGADMACHVLEVIDAIIESGGTNAFVDIHSDFVRPRPLAVPTEGEESSIRN